MRDNVGYPDVAPVDNSHTIEGLSDFAQSTFGL
jgi:hypothetical protein